MRRVFSHGFDQAPWWIRWYLPFAVWSLPANSSQVYLTFDDGPTPGITERVLRMLEEYQASASFFCLGSQAEKHPDLLKQIHSLGHSIGNHSYSHLNGWRAKSTEYRLDRERAERTIGDILQSPSIGFRPPYGRMKPWQWLGFPAHMKCYMWSVTAQDFIPSHSSRRVADIVVKNASSGSIILLHDSYACGEKMLGALPWILDELQLRGLHFKALPKNSAATGTS